MDLFLGRAGINFFTALLNRQLVLIVAVGVVSILFFILIVCISLFVIIIIIFGLETKTR